MYASSRHFLMITTRLLFGKSFLLPPRTDCLNVRSIHSVSDPEASIEASKMPPRRLKDCVAAKGPHLGFSALHFVYSTEQSLFNVFVVFKSNQVVIGPFSNCLNGLPVFESCHLLP